MGIAYAAAAGLVVPVLLFVFHLLSRPPEVTSQPPAPVPPAPLTGPIGLDQPGLYVQGPYDQEIPSVADEAERWLRSQTRN
ncbi:MAG TPA: hypothetical protein VG435_05195 [Acidimicrobiales bacterium]|nr:hypothetical protein [Acidimicrobiales bacterium]